MFVGGPPYCEAIGQRHHHHYNYNHNYNSNANHTNQDFFFHQARIQHQGCYIKRCCFTK